VKSVEGGKKGGLQRPRVNGVSEALPLALDFIEDGDPSVHLGERAAISLADWGNRSRIIYLIGLQGRE
jgi:hypothetical protein